METWVPLDFSSSRPFTGDFSDINSLLVDLRNLNAVQQNERVRTNDGRIIRDTTWRYTQGFWRWWSAEDHSKNYQVIHTRINQVIRVTRALISELEQTCVKFSSCNPEEINQRQSDFVEKTFTTIRIIEMLLEEMRQIPDAIDRWCLQYCGSDVSMHSKIQVLQEFIRTQNAVLCPRFQKICQNLNHFLIPLTLNVSQENHSPPPAKGILEKERSSGES